MAALDLSKNGHEDAIFGFGFRCYGFEDIPMLFLLFVPFCLNRAPHEEIHIESQR